MMNHAVARRYARALFELAQEKGLLDQVNRELELVVSMYETDSYLRAFMNDQRISPSQKRKVLASVLEGKVSPLVLHFLYVVVQKRREPHLPSMYRAFQDLANEAMGVVEVEVRSAVPLAEETARNLEAKLTTKLGKRVKLRTQVAPELIGGLAVRVGDTLMDGSVRTRLRRMHERLISAQSNVIEG
ncbi:F0F1 ATP synthase subunit delta [Symbiobacterium thermophilum]|uniref:ATP synthase subunit delta n=2 Tax=Symbiobacterium thermophilum TaxID=2734 RepID=ATPD_SYMTH|nr:F0F1 ATP synthase subunit delta [Symbiobacterium thermophilum]Q67TC0.1 RecName: Full=ATP synthase subunit delta; AltName: Full=ATP synthase F(1) sector subunit delta; AltName: Full=F-type ATPase subunit delta; Short=F-ATPase subunit delta [Symbiobacterium thermophilum IAM 14863]MBY6277217.1 F0F1 ATP synthase subunit delta [Symbiobacterium thermophilum]BAD39073.1 ATP synthase delta subunit [Symbiobacterium thermophilum IAM 14863]